MNVSNALDQLDDVLNAHGYPLVDRTSLSRALYSSDASLYRVAPAAVAVPQDRAHLETLVDAALIHQVPLTMRGAGTSCAGNAVGAGLIIDVGRHLNTIETVDSEARIATVDPGVIQSDLTAAALQYGLRFGPDPSTSNRCTIGGMIGNNACGPRALGYGRTSDNVVSLDVITGTGEHLRLDSRVDLTRTDSPTLQALYSLVSANLDVIRAEFGQFNRQVSGYSLEWLLPDNGFDVAKFLVGSEGTLAVVTQASVRLVADQPHKTMLALGYPTMAAAADAMPLVLPFNPTAVEGLDRGIVEVVINTFGSQAVPTLPDGAGWLFIELTDIDAERLATRTEQLLASARCLAGWPVTDPKLAARLWQIRSDGAGLAGVSLSRQAYPGWEDAAVPPDRLGEYLRRFDALLARHQLEGLPYGHFGDGCVHCRIDFPLTQQADGAAAYRAFIEEAADLVAELGGSMSGEHGDGRARSELLPKMYSPEALDLFAQIKTIFDPRHLLNPGVLVDPAPLDVNLRAPLLRQSSLADQHSELATKVHRCTGVGTCVSSSRAGAVMCPSYQATRNEKDSTRGRARVLQEMMNGTLLDGGWRNQDVHEALDLCLACKGCARNCPTGIDMASYKSEVLHHAFKGRLRPRDHYSMGWLPRWGRLITAVPGLSGLANLVMNAPGVRRLVKAVAGIDRRRGLPRFAASSNRHRVAAQVDRDRPVGVKGPVLVWVDSFSDAFESDHLAALVAVLVDAGYAPELAERGTCCGLTWITTGQRDVAARELKHAVEVLYPSVQRGIPIVGSEPSCLSVWHSDATELLPDDTRVSKIAAKVFTLAQFLQRDPDYEPPNLAGHVLVAQPHCHQASVIGWEAEAQLLARAQAEVVRVGGCCGLAGNWGMAAGHAEVSAQIAQSELIPAIEAAGPDAIVLADGFSCRTQVTDLTDRQALTLAELLAAHLSS